MGLAVVILLIGVPIGLFILVRPKKLWWVTGLGTDRVTIDMQLYWVDRYGNYDKADDEKCRLSGKWSSYLGPVRLTQVAPDTTILTNGAVVGPTGKVPTPPAPGNVVPERNG